MLRPSFSICCKASSISSLVYQSSLDMVDMREFFTVGALVLAGGGALDVGGVSK